METREQSRSSKGTDQLCQLPHEVTPSLVVSPQGAAPNRDDFLFLFSSAGKPEEPLETMEGIRVTEQGSQKPAADPSGPGTPAKPPVSAAATWDGRRRGEPPGEPAAFPQGLPAGAEEQRQFLTEQCVASLRLCLSRFPQHYKSLYRLAFLYTYSKTHRVSLWAVGRDGSLTLMFTCRHTPHPLLHPRALFAPSLSPLASSCTASRPSPYPGLVSPCILQAVFTAACGLGAHSS